eukprot:1140515-Prorocentrum_lima.AAC.1
MRHPNYPTGSSTAFWLTLASAAQEGCFLKGYEAAFLQSEGIDRLLLLRMADNTQPWDTAES